MGGIGIFFVLSAVIVLVPVVLQIRLGESRLREVWGYFVFVAGLLVVALADSDFGRGREIQIALLGVIIALAGLLLQPKSSNTSGRNPS